MAGISGLAPGASALATVEETAGKMQVVFTTTDLGISSKAEGGHDCIKEYLRSTDVFDGYFPMDLAETAKSAAVKDIKHYYHLYFPHGRYPKEAVGVMTKMPTI